MEDARIIIGDGDPGTLTGSPTEGFRPCRRVSRPNENVDDCALPVDGGSRTGEPRALIRGDATTPSRGDWRKRGDETMLDCDGLRLIPESERVRYSSAGGIA